MIVFGFIETGTPKRRILLYLTSFDEGQRLAQQAFRVNSSDKASQAYVAARRMMLQAEQLHRPALAGSCSACAQLLEVVPLSA